MFLIPYKYRQKCLATVLVSPGNKSSRKPQSRQTIGGVEEPYYSALTLIIHTPYDECLYLTDKQIDMSGEK